MGELGIEGPSAVRDNRGNDAMLWSFTFHVYLDTFTSVQMFCNLKICKL